MDKNGVMCIDNGLYFLAYKSVCVCVCVCVCVNAYSDYRIIV